MSTFGERLRTVRLAAGLSQAQLAGGGLSASYVSLLEAGKRTPSDEVVRQLADRLGCPPDHLIDDQVFQRYERVALELDFAQLAIRHGQLAEVRERLERLLSEGGLVPRLRDEAAYLVGVACERGGDHPGAVRTLLPLFERACVGQAHVLPQTLGLRLVGCYLEAGDVAQAVAVGERALTVAREQGLGETYDLVRLATTVVGACTDLGDDVRARALADELLALSRAGGLAPERHRSYWALGRWAEAEGRATDALTFYRQALRRLGEEDDGGGPARQGLGLAVALLGSDPPRVEDAIAVLDRCGDDLAGLGDRGESACWHRVRSVAALLAGDVAGAELQARRAVDVAAGVPAVEAAARQALGDVMAARGADETAAVLRSVAVEALGGGGVSRARALGWRELAERLAEDDLPAAVEAFRLALDAAGVRDRSRPHRAQVAALRARPPVPSSQG